MSKNISVYGILPTETQLSACLNNLRNEGFRRLSVNGILWAAGLESAITGTNNVSLVGPYNPTRYDFDGWMKGVKPSDMAGWESPIPR